MVALTALLPAAKLALGKSAAQAGAALATKAHAATVDAATDKKLKKTAQDFESVFLEQTFDRMFSNLGDEGPLGNGGTGGDVWRSMLAGEYARSVVKNGGVGISQNIYSELLKLQAGQGS
ncbi:MAG: rod-binding protein [Beijerinckiaceae bacterium]